MLLKYFLYVFISIAVIACSESRREQRYDKAAEEIKSEQGEDLLIDLQPGSGPDTGRAAHALKKFRQLYLDSAWMEAALLADSASVNFFRKTIRLANKADSITLSKEPVAARFYTVYVRHQFEREEMAVLTPQRLLAYILEKGVIINRAIEDAGDGFDNPTTSDEERVCGYMAKTLNRFCLNKENGKWLINFPQFFDRQIESMKYGAGYRKLHLNDHFKYVLEEITDYAKPKNPLWQIPR